MEVMMGNLSISDIEKRLGVEFESDIKDFMNERQQHYADNVQKGKWHCFDIPLKIVCGDVETAQKITSMLRPQAMYFKAKINISAR